MSRKVKFYVATLAAITQRAAVVAPNKGIAYDKAAGVLLSVTDSGDVYIRSTNLDVYFREKVTDVVEVGTETFDWRVNAELLDGIVQGLPLGSEVTFSQHEGEEAVRISCGRKRASLRLQDASAYPTWDRVSEDGMKLAPGFGRKIGQVAWAVDHGGNPPWSGVHVNGDLLAATDKYKLALVECEVPIEDKVTVPLNVLAPMLKNLPGDIRVRADDRMMHMLIGDEIEASCVLLEGDYPDVSRPLRDNFDMKVVLDKEHFLDTVSRMLVMVKKERYPWMRLTFSKNNLLIYMRVEGVGEITDEVSIDYDGDDFEIMFTPDFLTKAMEGSEQKKITWELGPTPTLMTKITDGTDYTAWVQPRRSTGDKQGASKENE